MTDRLVIGLGFGDEGKGTIVDHLVRRDRAAAVVRYSGGPQATHHVVLPDGRWHGFSQLGAGTFVPGVATHLTRDVLVDPVSLLREAEVLREKGVSDALARLTIDPRAALVLPYHKMIGQLAELARGGDRHGSVGMGVGEAARDPEPLRLEDCRDGAVLRARLEAVVPERLSAAEALVGSATAAERLTYFRRELEVSRLTRILHGFVKGYASLLATDETRLPTLRPLVFEGAQGVLLDPALGFPPFVTKTPVGAQPGAARRVGVLRAYSHRHGPGPLPSEDPTWGPLLPEAHNVWNHWQGGFRVGPLDLVLLAYAASVTRVDALAVTCLDRLEPLGELRVVTAYDFAGPAEDWFDEAMTWHDRGGRLRIEALRPSAHGAKLARVLAACRPAEERRLAGPDELVALIAETAGVPVEIRSLGPTHLDKR